MRAIFGSREKQASRRARDLLDGAPKLISEVRKQVL
jgi:hypothetical protein